MSAPVWPWRPPGGPGWTTRTVTATPGGSWRWTVATGNGVLTVVTVTAAAAHEGRAPQVIEATLRALGRLDEVPS